MVLFCFVVVWKDQELIDIQLPGVIQDVFACSVASFGVVVLICLVAPMAIPAMIGSSLKLCCVVLCFVFCVLCFVFCVLCFVFCVLCFGVLFVYVFACVRVSVSVSESVSSSVSVSAAVS